jgi:outer membrane receptor protein involved in Fe transport
MFRRLLLLLAGFFLFVGLQAQTKKLSGKVINEKNEPISSATLKLDGRTGGIAADVEGRFSLLLEIGKTYRLVVSSAGYKTKEINDLVVSANDIDNNIEIILQQGDKSTLTDVVVTTSVKKENTTALINFQKNNASLSSGLAADFIRKTPDRNTGEVLKRVSGASVQDNKFVIVRGLADRYNSAFINGTQLPSSEPDKKAFSFDLIPAALVDNIVINKTATPDLTGEFAGGLIQVTTRDIPSKNFLQIGASLGFNLQSVFKDFYSNERSNWDWAGFDDGRRNIPAGFPGTAQEYRYLSGQPGGLDQQLELTRLWRNDVYKEVKSTVSPIQTYNAVLGTSKVLKNGAKLGTVLSLIYRNSKLLYEVERANYEQDGTIIFNYLDEQNRYATNIGAMANIAYVKGKHKLAWKTLFNQYLDDNYFIRSGYNDNRIQDISLRSSFLNQRSLLSTVLEGDHNLAKSGIKLRWNGAYSLNYKKQPDLRVSQYVRNKGTNNPFEYDQDDTRRFNSSLEDHSFSGNASLQIPYTLFDEKQSLKVGGSTLVRFRNFQSRIFRYPPADPGLFNTDLAFLPYDQIFDDANITRQGFVMEEFTNNQDKYVGISALNGGYIMSDNKLSESWRVIWGIRLEFFEQFLRSEDLSAKEIVINNETWSWLPSVNLSYSITPKHILRFAAAKTVSRPEFREIAPFAFFDYESNYGISGNPDLKITDIYNLDLRYEWYPGGGQAVTFGGFYKRFVNPIEFRLDPGSNADRRLYFYQNATDADTYGMEIEARKDIVKNLNIFANFSYLFSQVRFTEDFTGGGKEVSANRPVQGQSPYLINAGLQYGSKEYGFNASLLYNRVGERLALVGYEPTGFPDVYERPRDLIDLQISKRILKDQGEIKLTVADLLNQQIFLYENLNDAKAWNEGTDRFFSKYRPGSTITIGFTYDFNLK